MHTGKPFSPACENNKQPILDGLLALLTDPGDLLEIGSGTGQHAAFLPAHLPHVRWQPSDLPDALPGMALWLEEAALANVLPPITLDVAGQWPPGPWRYLFTANTFHIMSQDNVSRCIEQGARRLQDGGLFVVYGPVNRCGQFTSDSNARFDAMLRERDPRSGIRDIEWLNREMACHGLQPEADLALPANNALMAWRN